MTLTQKMLQNNGIAPKSDTGNNGTDGNQTDTNAAAVDGNKGDDPAAAAKVEPVVPAATADPQGGGATAEPDEQSILKVLAARGINVKSLSELTPPAPAEPALTEAEKEAAEQQRQNDIRSFGLATGKITTKYFDSYIRESGLDPVELGFKLYRATREAEAKAAGDDAPDKDDLQKEFDELNFQYAVDSDPRRKAAEKRLQKDIDNYLETEYEKIYSLEGEYNTHQEALKKRKAYTADVNRAVSAIGDTLPFTVTDESNPSQKQEVVLKIKLRPDEIKAIETHFAGDEMFNAIGKNGVDAKNLAEGITNSLITKNLKRIISEVALAFADLKIKGIKMGRREIFTGTATGADAAGKKVTSGVKKILDRNKAAVR